MGALTNFLLSLFIARTLGATQFGAFSVAFVTYGFVLNASRGVSVDPLLIRFSGTYLPTWRRAVAGATGTALLVGLVSGACALAAGSLIGGVTGRAFVALGLTLPGLMLQDSWRHAFFALGRGYHAFLDDTVWAAVQIPLLAFLKISGHANVFWLVLAWGVAATAGAAIGILQSRVVPDLAGAAKWLWRHRDLGPRYMAANTAGNGADTLRSYGVTFILGLAAVGYIQASRTLMGPFNIVLFGLGLVMVPEAVRLLRRSPGRLPLFCAGVSAGLTLCAVAWGAVLLVALPRGLGHLMLGSLWRPTYPLVLPATLATASSCAATGAAMGLTALGAAGRTLRTVIFNSTLMITCGLVGAATGGTLGTMYWYAGASWVAAVVTWWQLRNGLKESGLVTVPRWLLAGRGRGLSTVCEPIAWPMRTRSSNVGSPNGKTRQLQMSRCTLSTMREPRRSSFTGSSGMPFKLSHTARWCSGAQMTSRKPPPPAPVSLAPDAPASSARATAASTSSLETPDASFRLASQLSRIAGPMASTSPLRSRSAAKPARSRRRSSCGRVDSMFARCSTRIESALRVTPV